MAGGVKRRPYESPKRRAQAEETRRQIMESARGLFLERGYVGTTIDAIAAGAGVASETVYAAFKTKRALLWRLLEVGAAGDEAPIPVQQRPWVRTLRRESDPVERARILARAAREVMDRSADLLIVLRDAAAADPELATTWDEVNRLMLEDHAQFVRALARGVGFRKPLDAAAARDIFWTLAGPEVYQRLVRNRGWSPDRYESWLAGMLRDQLLAP